MVWHPTAFAVPPNRPPMICRRRRAERPRAFCRQAVLDSTVFSRLAVWNSTVSSRLAASNSTVFSRLAAWNSTVSSRLLAWSPTVFFHPAAWNSTVSSRLAASNSTVFSHLAAWESTAFARRARSASRACAGPTASSPMVVVVRRVGLRSTASVVLVVWRSRADRAAPTDRQGTMPVRDGASF